MKRLMKAILWIGCYGGACWFVFKNKLGFDILSQNHWKLLFDKSVHSQWPDNMAGKKLVCKVLFAFIVVGILGLSVVIKKKKRRIPIVIGELPASKENFRPAPMISQGRIAAPAPVIPQRNSAASQSALISPPSVNLMGDAIRKITAVANNFNATAFPHVKLENTFTHLVISDDATALLLKILPQSGTWQVEQADAPEESKWTLDGEDGKNILKDIMESTATLARLEPEARTISVVILAGGNLVDPGSVRQYLEQHGIRIATLEQEIPDIPFWKDLLAEFYPPKEKEPNNEANATPQNM